MDEGTLSSPRPRSDDDRRDDSCGVNGRDSREDACGIVGNSLWRTTKRASGRYERDRESPPTSSPPRESTRDWDETRTRTVLMILSTGMTGQVPGVVVDGDEGAHSFEAIYFRVCSMSFCLRYEHLRVFKNVATSRTLIHWNDFPEGSYVDCSP